MMESNQLIQPLGYKRNYNDLMQSVCRHQLNKHCTKTNVHFFDHDRESQYHKISYSSTAHRRMRLFGEQNYGPFTNFSQKHMLTKEPTLLISFAISHHLLFSMALYSS